MKLFWLCYYVAATLFSVDAQLDQAPIQGRNVNLGEALQFLREYDTEASRICFGVTSAQWSYSTNMTDANKRRMIDEQTLKAKFDKLSWRRAATFAWDRLPDPSARRQLRLLLSNSWPSLPDDKYNEIYYLIAEMKDIYSKVRVCPFHSVNPLYCDLNLEDVTRQMVISRNDDELVHLWREWHDDVGPVLKNKYMRYTQIANLAARKNGFQDAGDAMRYEYEESEFMSEILETWRQLLPLYQELFTYVRRRLLSHYGRGLLRSTGPIPAHLLGNLWAQDWSKIYDLVIPYPEIKPIEITKELQRQGFTSLRLFQMAEEFYTSLGLKPLPPEFWHGSMLDKPNDRKVQCTSSAWDFCNGNEYRIKQCTEVNVENYMSTHREMAHIQYYLYYADLPYLYRTGANSAFHEAVAGSVLLSVANPNHLYRVGLTAEKLDKYENSINYLMEMALKHVAFAPFALIVDLWRYQIFEEGVENMNSIWWELRLRYQGLIPPLPRSEVHFDAASKRHIPADIPYIKYYVALLLQFQIHNAVCFAAKHPGPLHNCDIYRSKEAGRLLMDVMKMGRTRNWRDVFQLLLRSNSERLSAEPMLQYFNPLLIWLRVQNKNESVIGWTTNIEEQLLFQPFLINQAPQIKLNIILIMSVFISTVFFLGLKKN